MNSPRHTARALVISDEQLLLIERWRPAKHYFSIPGGGIEPGETPSQTAVREVLEETGCLIKLDRKLYILNCGDGSRHHIYLASHLQGEPHLPEDSPEFQLHDPNNRFQPVWLPLEQLASAPFNIWAPIASQLQHDLRAGFRPQVLALND